MFLVRKVLEKSERFALAVGVIIGQRQAFEDRLLATKTLEELTALEKEIEEWKFQAKLKLYAYHNIIAIDQLFNALTGGAADETLSSRTYRGAILAEQPKKRWACTLSFY